METTTNRAYDFSPLCQRKSLPSKSSTPPPEAPKAVDSREDPSSVLWMIFEEEERPPVGPLFEKTAKTLLCFTAKLSGYSKEELQSKNRTWSIIRIRVAYVHVMDLLFPSATVEMLGKILEKYHTTILNYREYHETYMADPKPSKEILEYRKFLKKLIEKFPLPEGLHLKKESERAKLLKRQKISSSSLKDDAALFLAIAGIITGLTESEILSEKRTKPHVYSRMATVIMLKWIHPEATVVSLGNIIGRDHTSIMHLFEVHNQFAMPEYHETEDWEILLYRKILGTMENVYRLSYLYSLFD